MYGFYVQKESDCGRRRHLTRYKVLSLSQKQSLANRRLSSYNNAIQLVGRTQQHLHHWLPFTCTRVLCKQFYLSVCQSSLALLGRLPA